MAACVQVFGRRDDGLTTRRGGRRLKSAKARSRNAWSTRAFPVFGVDRTMFASAIFDATDPNQTWIG